MRNLFIEPPRAVDDIFTKVGKSNTINVTWKSAKTVQSAYELGLTSRTDIKYYEIAYQRIDYPSVEIIQKVKSYGGNHEFSITGLPVGKTYQLRIRAVDRGDQVGQWSDYVEFKARKYYKTVQFIAL